MKIQSIQSARFFSMLVILALTFSAMGVSPARAAGTRYATPTGAGDCSSWASACTLQTALTGAASGDEIWVAAGTYKPTTGTDRAATFQLKDGVAVYGGFAGTETTRDQRDWATNLTILSGDLNGDDSGFTNNSENSYHVVTGATGATLDGFIITAGNANGSTSPTDQGGGMYNNSSSPALMNITFSSNSTSQSGGGMYNTSSSPALTNVTFSGNSAYYGGGMLNEYSSSPVLTNVTFSGNSATDNGGGGGMFNFTNSSPTLTNVTFSDNSASHSGHGGGMLNFSSSSPVLTNVTFGGNSATWGGGMDNTSSSPTLTNVTFSGNSASVRGGGLDNISSNPQIRNTILWGNTASDGAQIFDDTSFAIVNDSVVQGGYTGGTNIITTDPLLGTLGNYGGFTQTLPLLAGSSAIDTGNDATCAATDQRGVTRPQGVHCDIGAYEFVPLSISGNAGVAGATLAYLDGGPKFVTADGSGLYSLTVPAGWSGSLTPVKAGYSFTPASRSYSNLTTDQPDQDFAGAFRFSISNGMPATLVLGQIGFNTGGGATTQTSMRAPASVAVDPVTGKVFVADRYNNRVLRFGSLSALSNGAAAEAVLGQPNFTSSAAANTPGGMDYPSGVFVDTGGRLWVAEFWNNRVLRFDAAVSKPNGAPADGVLGQPNFTSKLGATTQSHMGNPFGVFVDAGGRLWVADRMNSRVLRFDNAASLPNGAPADGVLGQPDFVSATRALTQSGLKNPDDIFVDLNGVLWVADNYNNRVLRFDNAALKANGAPADGVLGQPDFTSGAAVTSQNGMSHPFGLAGDGTGRLYVMEDYNNRVLVFNDATSKPNGGDADNVLGQTGFVSQTGGTSATTLRSPSQAFYDPAAEVLWVADSGNSRVLLYGTPGGSYTVSGALGVNGAGATVSYTGGAITADALTGAYSFRVPSGWTGMITPAKGDYSFAPLSIIVNAPVTADLPGRDFAATLNPYTISGNAGVGGARVAYTGTTSGATTAEAVSGAYSFRVPSGWSGSITASRAGYLITPASINVSAPVTADLPGQDFTASLNARLISGNAGVAGAVLTYTDGQPKFVTADASGAYLLTVSPGWSGRVAPLKTGYSFTPPSRSYTNLSTDQTGQDFTATVISANPVLTPGGTTRVSLGSGDVQGNNGSGTYAISANGRYLAFHSNATNLVAGDTNGVYDIFLRDLQLGTTTRISVASDGTQANGYSLYPAISADGRFVVFASVANNLVAGDSSSSNDIFLRDTQLGITTRVSAPVFGSGRGASEPSISADGRYVAFQGEGNDYLPTYTGTYNEVFVRDMWLGATTIVSLAADGGWSNGQSSFPVLSADGRYVAFSSEASNLVSGDTNAAGDFFRYDMQLGTLTRISLASDGSQANGGAGGVSSISADGRYFAFASEASNLVPGDTNAAYDVFARDLQLGLTTRVSVDSAGGQDNELPGPGGASLMSISPDGRYVAFDSGATNLVPGDTNAVRDIFLHDTQSGATTRVSVASDDSQANAQSYIWYFSFPADGRYVTFMSQASNLAPGDTNAQTDIFIRDTDLLVSGNAGVAGATLTYTGGSTTADGSGLYSFMAPFGWTGTITPSKPGYIFSPALINITTPVTADLPDQNFTIVSTNADLSNLVFSTGALTPAFDPATTTYTQSVTYTVTSLTVTPTVADAAATVAVNGTTVASGSASGPINLVVGPNTITTIVTAQDGTSTKTYTVTVTRAADNTAPTINTFTATTPSNSLNIPITAFTASDNVGVTGYKITASATPPTAGAAGWSGTAPTTYTVGSAGTYTLYPWAKDGAGNISEVFSTPFIVVVDNIAPTVDTFTATTPTNSLNIPITAFSASDNVAVTGYKITESATPPTAGADGWSGTAPTTYTVGSAGTYTLYPWAKDAVGNVSAVFATPPTVVVDNLAPTVDTFTATTPTNSLNIPITAFTASDNLAVTGYLITESAMVPAAGDAGWSGTVPTTYTVPSAGTYTLYPWAKDAVGNVSAVFATPPTVVVDTIAPTVDTFSATTPTNSLNIPITAFSASDNLAVTEYLITESSTVPSAGAVGWTGTVPTAYTVARAGTYTLYPWAKDAVGNVSAVFGSPSTVTVSANIEVLIAGLSRGIYNLLSGESTRQSYAGANAGPVKINTTGAPILAAQRILYTGLGTDPTSFVEMMGLPDSQLDTTYWFPWYKNDGIVDTQLRLGNVSASTATVHVYVAGVEVTGSPFTLTASGAGQSQRLSFALNDGPVKVVSTQNIVATERLIYFNSGDPASFSEMMGLPNSQLSKTYWFPWYKNVGEVDTQLRIGNVSGSTATVHIYIAGVEVTGSPFTLTASGAGQSQRLSFALNDGPVKIVSDQNIVAAQRLIYYEGGLPTSFVETMAIPDGQLNTTQWFPWYKNDGIVDTQLRIGNVSGAAASVHVYIGTTEMAGSPFALTATGAGQSLRLSFTANDGPVKIVSDQNVVTSERLIYFLSGVPVSFSEMMGTSDNLLSPTWWLPWYKNVAEIDTQLRFAVP